MRYNILLLYCTVFVCLINYSNKERPVIPVIWAGKPRTVNLTKDGFTFLAAKFLDQTLQYFEKEILMPNPPCHGSRNEVVRKIATVHLELLFIHPYREGNGRTARLLATLMALQAGFNGFDWEVL